MPPKNRPRPKGKKWQIPPGLAKKPCVVCGRDVHTFWPPASNRPMYFDPEGYDHLRTCDDLVALRKVRADAVP